MAARKRTSLEIERDRAEIARRSLRGELQAEIATALNLTQQMVSYDIAVVEQRWQESAVSDRSAKKARQLARIDHLEREYWQSWDASRGAVHETPVSETYPGEADLLVAQRGSRGKKKAVQTFAEPDPRYLEGVRWCIAERSKTEGHYAPTKQDVSIHDDDAALLARGRALGLVREDTVAGGTGTPGPLDPPPTPD